MSCAALHCSNGGSKMLTPSASQTDISPEKDLLIPGTIAHHVECMDVSWSLYATLASLASTKRKLSNR